MTTAWIGLGGNLGQPARAFGRALAALDQHSACRVVRVSPLYRSAPWGKTDQPEFVNAVAALATSLDAEALMALLGAQEKRLGRQRGVQRWGPRTIDLDLLMFGQQQFHCPELTVPHPRLHQRAFVLRPLADLDADLRVPGRGRVIDLLAALPEAERHSVHRVAPADAYVLPDLEIARYE